MLNPSPLSLLIPREAWPGIECVILVQDVVAEYSKPYAKIFTINAIGKVCVTLDFTQNESYNEFGSL